MVLTATVMVDMRKERPDRKGEVVLMRTNNHTAVDWVQRCRRGGGGGEGRVGALMRMVALEGRGGRFFEGKGVYAV